MENDNPTTETVQNPPEEAGTSRSSDADNASLEAEILSYADFTYQYRRQAMLDAAKDEAAFLSAFKDFQRCAAKFSGQLKAITHYCENVNMRVSAIDVLNRVRLDLVEGIRIAQRFEAAHVEAQQLQDAAPAANLKLDGIYLFKRLDVTLAQIKSGKDAELALRTAHEEAMKEVAPRVRHLYEVTRDHPFKPILIYPIPLPPKGEPVPNWPEAFLRFSALPPEDMERYPNLAFKVPQGYRDENGEDVTHIWDVDWEDGGKVTSVLTEEETDHGRRQWYTWCREHSGMKMPPECTEYTARYVDQVIGKIPDSEE